MGERSSNGTGAFSVVTKSDYAKVMETYSKSATTRTARASTHVHLYQNMGRNSGSMYRKRRSNENSDRTSQPDIPQTTSSSFIDEWTNTDTKRGLPSRYFSRKPRLSSVVSGSGRRPSNAQQRSRVVCRDTVALDNGFPEHEDINKHIHPLERDHTARASGYRSNDREMNLPKDTANIVFDEIPSARSIDSLYQYEKLMEQAHQSFQSCTAESRSNTMHMFVHPSRQARIQGNRPVESSAIRGRPDIHRGCTENETSEREARMRDQQHSFNNVGGSALEDAWAISDDPWKI